MALTKKIYRVQQAAFKDTYHLVSHLVFPLWCLTALECHPQECPPPETKRGGRLWLKIELSDVAVSGSEEPRKKVHISFQETGGGQRKFARREQRSRCLEKMEKKGRSQDGEQPRHLERHRLP